MGKLIQRVRIIFALREWRMWNNKTPIRVILWSTLWKIEKNTRADLKECTLKAHAVEYNASLTHLRWWMYAICATQPTRSKAAQSATARKGMHPLILEAATASFHAFGEAKNTVNQSSCWSREGGTVTEKDICRVTGKRDALHFHALQLVMPGNQQRVSEDKFYTNTIAYCVEMSTKIIYFPLLGGKASCMLILYLSHLKSARCEEFLATFS